jgi:hypothetical protein
VCRHSCHDPKKPRHSRGDEIIIPRAIVYLSADKSFWKVLLEADRAYYGIAAALQEFTKVLEREMGRVCEEKHRREVGSSRKRVRGKRDAEDDLPRGGGVVRDVPWGYLLRCHGFF